MVHMYDGLLEYLEADLAGAQVPATRSYDDASPARLLQAVAELANSEWTEDEAAREAVRLARPDALRAAYAVAFGSLLSNPFVDILGIRITRILLAAIDEPESTMPTGQ